MERRKKLIVGLIVLSLLIFYFFSEMNEIQESNENRNYKNLTSRKAPLSTITPTSLEPTETTQTTYKDGFRTNKTTEDSYQPYPNRKIKQEKNTHSINGKLGIISHRNYATQSVFLLWEAYLKICKGINETTINTKEERERKEFEKRGCVFPIEHDTDCLPHFPYYGGGQKNVVIGRLPDDCKSNRFGL